MFKGLGYPENTVFFLLVLVRGRTTTKVSVSNGCILVGIHGTVWVFFQLFGFGNRVRECLPLAGGNRAESFSVWFW